MNDEAYERAIAVIGMSGRFPGAKNLEEYWELLAEGREAIEELSDEELLEAGVPRELLENPAYVKAASRLAGVDGFDAGFFGYSAREAEILDPQQRLFLEHAWEALEVAGVDPARFDGLIGVYAGVAWNTYLLSNLTTRPELFDGGGAFQVFITNDKDFMPTRAAYKMNLKGPAMIVQTSCSTSLVATHLACLSLLSYECDLALVGGVTVKVPQTEGYWFQEGSLASPDGHCRAFDADAAGTIFGSGVGMVALKRLAEAVEDGDDVRAVIRGSAINNDGSVKVSYTAPSVEGQAEVVAAAQAVADVAPETIRYVECHGTGTSLGDPIEVTALTKVFQDSTDEIGFCALGSVKTNVGHLDAAAGVAGLIKTVLALEHGEIPPSLHYDTPNPAIDFAASPFYVAAAREPFTPRPGAPRRAGVSSFGVGGTNAHVILEEAPEPEPSDPPARPWQLVPLSARSDEALEAQAERLRKFLEGEAGAELTDPARFADLAWTLQTGRAVFRHRRVLAARNREDLLNLLSGEHPERDARFVDDEEPRERPVVFLFSGQGSQYPNMGRELYDTEPVFRDVVDRAAEILKYRFDVDLLDALYPEGEVTEAHHQRLEQTELAQPVLFVVEVALARLFGSWGIEPQALIGHSIGELAAAHLAGVFSFENALGLVAQRGRLMGELPTGTMLAVPLPEADLESLLPAGVSVAVVNEPERSVASGPEEAVAELEAVLEERGVASRRLHTSHAFHSAMMEPAVDGFARAVESVERHAPEVPFISNVTGNWITPEDAVDPQYWAQHLRSTVRFAGGLAKILVDPSRVLLELGPGRTLKTLASRHPERSGQPVLTSLPHPKDDTPAGAAALLGLGRLWAAGVEFEWERLHETGDGPELRRRMALPTYPFERQRYWIDPAPEGRSRERRAAATAAEGRRPDPAQWLYVPGWELQPVPEHPEEEAPPEGFLVLADDVGMSEALAQRLAADGRRAVRVVPGEETARREEDLWTLPPGDDDACRRLLSELADDGFAPDVVVHAWTLGLESGEAGSELVWERGFWTLLALLHALLETGGDASEPLDVTLVSDGLEQVTGAEIVHPDKAPMVGLLTVLPQEHPRFVCRTLDLPMVRLRGRVDTDRIAHRILAEIDRRTTDERVLLRGAQRWVRSDVPVTTRLDDAPLRDGGTYLLTGPVAGNVYALARWLAREYGARLALLRPAGDPADQDHWQARRAALEELGAEVSVHSLELTDEEAVTAAVSEVWERFGALHGVVHAAGTVGERTFRVLRETGREEAAWHFDAKVKATGALDRAVTRVLTEEPVDFAVLLSSLATVVGGLAYGPYTAANLWLDAFARQSFNRDGLRWKSVGWDVWQFEDEREQITEVREDLADLAMGPREGEEAFRRVLAVPDVDLVYVSTVDLATRRAERRERIGALRGRLVGASGDGAAESHPRPSLPTPFVAPETEMERRIAAVWCRTLGFEEIGVQDNFFDLGGDSFVAVQVAERLQKELDRELPVAQLYEGLTVRALAETLDRQEERAEERRAQLEERREVADRRKQLLERRRARTQEARDS